MQSLDDVIEWHMRCSHLQDVQNKIKELFRGIPDEFMINEHALQAKVRLLLSCAISTCD